MRTIRLSKNFQKELNEGNITVNHDSINPDVYIELAVNDISAFDYMFLLDLEVQTSDLNKLCFKLPAGNLPLRIAVDLIKECHNYNRIINAPKTSQDNRIRLFAYLDDITIGSHKQMLPTLKFDGIYDESEYVLDNYVSITGNATQDLNRIDSCDFNLIGITGSDDDEYISSMFKSSDESKAIRFKLESGFTCYTTREPPFLEYMTCTNRFLPNGRSYFIDEKSYHKLFKQNINKLFNVSDDIHDKELTCNICQDAFKRKHFFAAPFVECMLPDNFDSTIYRNGSTCSLKVIRMDADKNILLCSAVNGNDYYSINQVRDKYIKSKLNELQTLINNCPEFISSDSSINDQKRKHYEDELLNCTNHLFLSTEDKNIIKRYLSKIFLKDLSSENISDADPGINGDK